MKHRLLQHLIFPFLISSASAITVSLDFSDSSNAFFDTGTTDGMLARAAVQAADSQTGGASPAVC